MINLKIKEQNFSGRQIMKTKTKVNICLALDKNTTFVQTNNGA